MWNLILFEIIIQRTEILHRMFAKITSAKWQSKTWVYLKHYSVMTWIWVSWLIQHVLFEQNVSTSSKGNNWVFSFDEFHNKLSLVSCFWNVPRVNMTFRGKQCNQRHHFDWKISGVYLNNTLFQSVSVDFRFTTPTPICQPICSVAF